MQATLQSRSRHSHVLLPLLPLLLLLIHGGPLVVRHKALAVH